MTLPINSSCSSHLLTPPSSIDLLGIENSEVTSKHKYDTFSYKDEQSDPMSDINRLRDELERIRQQSDAMGESFSDLTKAFRISMRIMAGDIVPDSDDRFLLEKFPEMHLRAWMLRRMKEEPTEYDSVLDDDNDNSSIIQKTSSPELNFQFSANVEPNQVYTQAES
jgi:hypothetical protein